MPRRPLGLTNVLSLLAAFVACAMLLGVLTAGIAVPFVGASGAVANSAVGTFDALPAQLAAPVMAQQTRILANDGKTVLATLYKDYRVVEPLAQIAPIMQKAQVAIEDDRFYEHGGVDTRGIVRAFVSTMRGDKQGASTITQQYVRQSLIANAISQDNAAGAQAAQERGGVGGIMRKLQEAKFAIEMEKKKSKDEILEGYLNLVYYGANAYGVQAAAQRYFSVDANKLTLPQAALLAGMVQAPTTYNPFEHPQAAVKRRNEVLDRMAATGAITPDEAATTKQQPLGLNPKDNPPSNCEGAGGALDENGKNKLYADGDFSSDREPNTVAYKWACLYVKNWIQNNVEALGANPKEREVRLANGGFTIKTTLDANILTHMRQAMTQQFTPVASNEKIDTAGALVEPGTGRILGLSQSGFSTQNQIFAVDNAEGTTQGFQIGSTAKMFALVAALKQGKTANSMVNAPVAPAHYDENTFHASDCGMGVDPRGWDVSNADGEEQSGWMSLRQATVWSLNTAFATLTQQIGICSIANEMKSMGLHNANGGDYAIAIPDVLGSGNASPLTVASAYASLAAGGKYCAPYVVDSITDVAGTSINLSKFQKQCTATDVDPKLAYDVTSMLKEVVSTSTTTPLAGGRIAAGKTGTTDGSAAMWMTGYTPQLAASVWSGRWDTNKQLDYIPGLGQWGKRLFGNNISGPTWKKIMDYAHEEMSLPQQDFTRFQVNAGADGTIKLPDFKGVNQDEATKAMQNMGLNPQVDQNKVNADGLSWGQVASTEPGAGATVHKGDTINVKVASGWWGNGGPNNNGNNGGGWNNNGNGNNGRGNGNGNGNNGWNNNGNGNNNNG